VVKEHCKNESVVIERNEEGIPTIWCDSCIAPIIKALNDAELKTIASCCGHGHRPVFIALEDGREIIITTYEEARKIDKLFPNIHGEDSRFS